MSELISVSEDGTHFEVLGNKQFSETIGKNKHVSSYEF